MTKLEENAVRIGKINVPYKPQEAHRHLVTLPTGGRFVIFDYPEPTAKQLERLLVFDAHKKPDSQREAQRTVIGTVRLLPGPGGTTDIMFDAKDAVYGEEITEEKRALFYEYFQLVKAHFGVSESCSVITEDGGKKQRGPTITTQERAMVFRRLKEEHPEWTQERVAMKACEELKVENLTGDSVRNAYRLMRRAYPDQADEWTWERADRIR